ncbi:MAG TPA: hypothetical protein VNK96_03145 [Fimbriimonadales bacterium]|nr:hypothetical protein [Fimbriimonadales bacterium]
MSTRNKIFIWIFPLGLLLASGCNPNKTVLPDGASAQPPEPPHKITHTANELVNEALQSLQVSGIPEPPLNAKSTREDRTTFLLATKKCLQALLMLPQAETSTFVPPPNLVPPNRTEEILVLSRVLAVELADAIDRNDAKRAAAALRAAFHYADYVASESIASALAASAITDVLISGVKTVSSQLDASMTEHLLNTIEEVANSPAPIESTFQNEKARLRKWKDTLAHSKQPVSVAQFLSKIKEFLSAENRLNPDTEKMLRAFAKKTSKKSESLPPALLAQGASLAYRRVEETLAAALKGKPTPNLDLDPKSHLIASLYLWRLKPWLINAKDLDAIRQENFRLLALSIRLLSMELPDSLQTFGENAISPVNGLPFEYKRLENDFELVRPRKTKS